MTSWSSGRHCPSRSGRFVSPQQKSKKIIFKMIIRSGTTSQLTSAYFKYGRSLRLTFFVLNELKTLEGARFSYFPIFPE